MLKTNRSLSSTSLLNQIFEKLFVSEKNRSVSKKHRYQFEALEERIVLSADVGIHNLPTEINVVAGSTYHVALDGFGDANLTYTIRSAGDAITTSSVLENNHSIKLHLAEMDDDGNIITDYGYIIFELFEGETPETAARIKNLVESGFYDGLTFHRIIENFMIQGGCPKGDGTGGSGLGTIKDEFSTLLSHNGSGYVSMANSNKAASSSSDAGTWNTGDCQFFITDKAVVRLDNLHTIFGFITEGDAIRDLINSVETDKDDKPLNNIVILSAEVINDTENGILRVTTDSSKTGTETLTVTVTDQDGNSQDYDIKVNVAKAPYISTLDDIELKAGESTTVTLPDLNGFGEYTVSRYYASHPGIEFEMIDATTLKVTARADVSGLQFGTLIVDDMITSGQYLYVFVTPAAPNMTLTTGDTGIVGDGITSSNNSDADSVFEFTMDNIIPQATLTLTMNGQEIPYTVVSTEVIDKETGLLKVVIRTVPGGDNTLADGSYVFRITQTQTFATGSGIDHAPLLSDKSTAITVRVVSKAPVITNPDEDFLYDASIEEELKIPLITNQDSNGDVVFTITSSNTPEGMRISADGKHLVWTPQAGQIGGEYPITITATNGSGLSSSVTINVLLQQGPQFVFEGETTVDENSTVEIDLKPAEGDETEGTITYTLDESSLPAGVEYTFESTGDQTAKFTWTTTETDGPGVYTIVFVATDEDGKARRKSVTITINEVNQDPYFDPINETLQATEHTPFEYTVKAKDDDLPANTLTYQLLGNNIPQGMTINAETGKITWTPGETHGGSTVTVTVQVSDGAGGTATIDIKIAVEETDDPPVFQALPDLFRLYDNIGTYMVRISASDPDIPANSIKYSLEGNVPEGMTIDPDTGIIEWNVPTDYLELTELIRSINVTVKATEIIQGTGDEEDTEGLFTLKTISFEITNREYSIFLAAQSAKRDSNRQSDIPQLPDQADSRLMQQRAVVDTTSPLDAQQMPVNSLRGFASDISFGFDGFTSGMPVEEFLRLLEEGDNENNLRGRHSVFSPISPARLLQSFEQGLAHANQALAEKASETVEKSNQIVQAVFEHLESHQDMEDLPEVIEYAPINHVADYAINDLIVEDRMEQEDVLVKVVSKDEFQAAMNQVKMFKK